MKDSAIDYQKRQATVKAWLAGLTVAMSLIAAVLANRMADVGIGFMWWVPTAVVAYMGCVACDNITTELFGWNQAKTHTYVSFVAQIAMVLLFVTGLVLPTAPWVDDSAWHYVLGNTWRVVVASVVAYVVSSFINSYIINQMKKKAIDKYHDTNKHLGLRTCVSTIIAQAADAGLFISLAFLGTENFSFGGIYRQWIVKLLIAMIWVLIETPIIKGLKKYTGADAVETDSSKLTVF